MRKGYVVALLLAALLGGASGVRAQAAATATGKSQATTPTQVMARHHRAMARLQSLAIKEAAAAERLSHFKKMNQKAVAKQATRSRNDLQAVLKHADEAEKVATAEQRQHLAQVRTHDQEALKHAEELVAEAQKATPENAAISAHAKGVLEHARAARAVMAGNDEQAETSRK